MDYVHVRKFSPFAILRISKTENWLKEQAQKGYKLVAYKGWTFTFQKCQSKTREYFIYTSPGIEKNDRFLGELSFIKNLYGDRKSTLNKRRQRIIEIDPQKINGDYKFYLLWRNRHYLNYYWKLLVATLFVFSVCFVMTLIEKAVHFFALLSLPPILYFFVSIFLLRHQRKQLKKTGDGTTK